MAPPRCSRRWTASTADARWSTSSTCRSSARSHLLEFCFLADWYFRQRGIRDRVEIIYVTPLDAAFTKPVAAHRLAGMLAEKQIALIIEFNRGEVDGPRGALIAFDGREVAFDLAVIVPVHSGADYVGRSPGLGDALNFVETDEHTLQSKVAVNMFVIGDAANVPASKAGSVTHFEGDTVVDNILRASPARHWSTVSMATPTTSSRPGSTRRC
jgi:sulfide:quinone oxidoreductase